jgi:hypothetical protein
MVSLRRIKTYAMTALLVAGMAACQPRGEQETEIFGQVRQNQAEALAAYLAAGGDPDAQNRGGDPLAYVASGPLGGEEVLSLLLDAGANPNAKSGDGRTLLENAASWCDEGMVALLLARGADPNLPGKNGVKPADAVCNSPVARRAPVLALILAAGGTLE